MIQNVSEVAQRAALSMAMLVTSHPMVKWRAAYLKYKHNTDFAEVGREFGLNPQVLIEQQAKGFDVPGYRFSRDGGFFHWLNANREKLKGMSWIDVGAGTGCVSAYMKEYLGSTDMSLWDVDVPSKTNFTVNQFDGKRLNFPDKSVDIVLFAFVLHHASGHTVQLLQDAHRIARKHVFVLEDPKDTAQDFEWAYRHDKSGTFRTTGEWIKLFQLTGFEVADDIKLSDEIHSRHFFNLVPVESSAALPPTVALKDTAEVS